MEFMEDQRKSIIHITEYGEYDDDTCHPFSTSLSKDDSQDSWLDGLVGWKWLLLR